MDNQQNIKNQPAPSTSNSFNNQLPTASAKKPYALRYTPYSGPNKPNRADLVKCTKGRVQPVVENTKQSRNSGASSAKSGGDVWNHVNSQNPHHAPPVRPRDAADAFVPIEEMTDVLDLYPDVIQCPTDGCHLVGPRKALDFHYVSTHASLMQETLDELGYF